MTGIERLDFDHVVEVGTDYSGRRLGSLSAHGSRFERCRFDQIRCDQVVFGAGMELTEYVDCSFDGVRFPSILAGYSRFVRCTFRDAFLGDFGDDYLELVDCLFTGKLRSTIFWGAPPRPTAEKRYQSLLRMLERSGRPVPPGFEELSRRPTNEFRGNDFSGAELLDITFRNIDLTLQRLPRGDEYLYLPHAEAAIDGALAAIGDRPGGPAAEDFLRRILGHEVSRGQRQLLLRQADFDNRGKAAGVVLAFDVLRVVDSSPDASVQ